MGRVKYISMKALVGFADVPCDSILKLEFSRKRLLA